MGAEDFSYMLEARPGAFVFIGNGATADLHNAAYDFNDEAIPYGVSYWASLAEIAARRLKVVVYGSDALRWRPDDFVLGSAAPGAPWSRT